MKIIREMIAIFFVVIFSVSAVVARDLTPAEQGRLKMTVAEFEAALRAGDFLTVQSAIPPKIISRIAFLADVSVDELTQGVAAKMSEAMQAVTLESFGMDVSKAVFQSTSSDRPYALIPTEMTIASEGTGRIAVTSYTLAFLDAEGWFLVRVSEAHLIAMLREAYPDFVGIEFPRGSVKALE